MSSLIFLIFGGTTDGASPFSTSASATILSTMSANIEVANLLPMMFDQWNFLGCNSSGGFCPFTASGASLLFPLLFPLPSLPCDEDTVCYTCSDIQLQKTKHVPERNIPHTDTKLRHTRNNRTTKKHRHLHVTHTYRDT